MDRLLNIVKEFKNSEKTVNLKHILRNKLDKAYLAHDAAYSDNKHFIKRNTKTWIREIFQIGF